MLILCKIVLTSRREKDQMKQLELFNIREKETATETQLIDNIKREVKAYTEKDVFIAVESLKIDNLKNEITTQIKKRDFDLYSHIDKFLTSNNRSPYTIRNYKNMLTHFIKFLDARGLSFLDLNYSICLDYFNTLNSLGLKRDTQKLYKSTLSSFTSYLILNDIIDRNYFTGVKITKKEEEKEKLITKRQLDIIIKAIKREDYKDAVRVMSCLGLRVSELNSYEVKGEVIEVKGKGEKKRKINIRLLGKVIDLDLKAIERVAKTPVNIACLKVAINRLSKKSPISSGFSCHSFRHYFSHDYYAKSGNDILKLRDLLGHCSISITDHYLKGLKAYE